MFLSVHTLGPIVQVQLSWWVLIRVVVLSAIVRGNCLGN